MSRATITSSAAAGMPRKPQPHRGRAFVHVAAGAQVQVLAVIDDRQIERLRELHRAPHHARVHHRPAVVGDGDNAGRFHGADGGQFLAGAAFGDGADREDVDHRAAARPLHDVAGHGGAVVHRLGVGHAADGGEAAGRRGARAGLDGFGVLEARLAQVHVHVDEAGRHDQAGGIEHLRLRRRRDSAPRRRCGRPRSAHRRCDPCSRPDRSRGRS